MGNKSSTASKQAPPMHNPGDGIRSLESSGMARTTDESKRTGFWTVAKKSKTINEAAFRTLNFELYMKPNKPIMIFGVATMTFITSYFAYTQATTGTERGYRRPKNYLSATIAQNWPLFDLQSRLYWQWLPINNFDPNIFVIVQSYFGCPNLKYDQNRNFLENFESLKIIRNHGNLKVGCVIW